MSRNNHKLTFLSRLGAPKLLQQVYILPNFGTRSGLKFFWVETPGSFHKLASLFSVQGPLQGVPFWKGPGLKSHQTGAVCLLNLVFYFILFN